MNDLEYNRNTWTRDDADRALRAYEDDYQRYSDENKSQAADWWTKEKQDMKAKMAEMRTNLDKAKDNAPNAWDEMKEGFGNAMDELKTGYQKTIRELKR